ncbi:MAG: hypothetical protein RLY85_1059 [Bacteroidota bacterium]|jgi:hypothetical protein
MTTIRTILTISLFFAYTTGKAQFISEISGGIGTNGLSATLTHQLSKKLIFGETFTAQYWKPSVNADFINRNGLAIMTLKFLQTGAFLRWHPNGEEHMYGYQKTGLYLTAGAFYKFNDNWFTTTTYFAKRKRKRPDTGEVFYQTGAVEMNLVTNRIQPFVGMGFNLLGNDSKVTLQFEGGLSFHGRPDGFITTTGDVEIILEDRLRMEKLKRNFLGFAFFQLHVGYNYYDIHNSAFPTRF